MKLINKTKYDTAQLRAVLVAVHREEAKRRGRLRTWDRLVVSVSRRSKSHTSGHAFYHGRKSHLTLPAVTCTTAALTAIWLHELQHLYGIKHDDMSPAVRNLRETDLSPWIEVATAAAETDLLQEKPEAVVPPMSEIEKAARLEDRREKALASIEHRLILWDRKRARAERAIAKLKTQERYYRGALAASRGKA